MSLNRTWANVEALRNIIGFQSRGVEPFFQCLGLTAMAEGVPEPNALQGKHFVESGSSTRFERKVWVSSDADIHNVVGLAKIIWDLEPCGRRELIVGVKRRCVAANAALPLEDDLTFSCALIEFVRIRRRFQRVDVESQSVKLFVAVSRALIT